MDGYTDAVVWMDLMFPKKKYIYVLSVFESTLKMLLEEVALLI